MDNKCSVYAKEQLEAWIDGENDFEDQDIKTHILSCAVCRDVCQNRRVYRARMRRFQTETNARALPFNLLKTTRLAMDDADRTNSPRQGSGRATFKTRLTLAGAVFVVAAIGAFALNSFRISKPLSISAIQSIGSRQKTIATSDPDFASNWMSKELATKTPTINLSLVNATLVSASADRESGVGKLEFETGSAEKITLCLSFQSPIENKGMTEKVYMGVKYFCEEGSINRIEWEAEGKNYAVISSVNLDSLLPVVREMDLHCRKRER